MEKRFRLEVFWLLRLPQELDVELMAIGESPRKAWLYFGSLFYICGFWPGPALLSRETPVGTALVATWKPGAKKEWGSPVVSQCPQPLASVSLH